MIHKKQRGQLDCGVAVLAMCAGISLGESRRLVAELGEGIGRIRGLRVGEMASLLRTTTARRWRVSGPHGGLADWDAPNGRVAAIVWPGPGHVGHWVALCDGVVYDPKEHHPTLPSRSLRGGFQVTRAVTEV